MGKTPVVVGDCPGFVVNRVLTPYLIAFLQLVRDGVDFHPIDKVMESFRLADGTRLSHRRHRPRYFASCRRDRVGGLSGPHAAPHPSAIDILQTDGRLGQKNGRGFYVYTRDPKGRPRKDADPAVPALLAAGQPRGTAASLTPTSSSA